MLAAINFVAKLGLYRSKYCTSVFSQNNVHAFEALQPIYQQYVVSPEPLAKHVQKDCCLISVLLPAVQVSPYDSAHLQRALPVGPALEV